VKKDQKVLTSIGLTIVHCSYAAVGLLAMCAFIQF